MANSVSRHHHQLTADGAGYVAGIKSAEAATRALQSAQGSAASATQAGSKAASRFGVVAQQAGYQVQDFAVQVAAGQNKLVAFAQQGSQMLGVFGPTGAIAGAVLAVGVLVTRMFTMETSSKDAKKSAAELEKTYADLESRLKSVATQWDKVNKGYKNLGPEMSTETQMGVRNGLEKEAIPRIEDQAATAAGFAAIAKARSRDDRYTTNERLEFQKEAVKYSEQEADAQERLLGVKQRIQEFDEKNMDDPIKGIEEQIKAWDKNYQNQFKQEKTLAANRAIEREKAKKATDQSVDDLLHNFFYNIDHPSALKMPETPSALRTSAGASALGGTAVSGDTVFNLQKQTLDVQKQILAEQKRLTSFWGNN